MRRHDWAEKMFAQIEDSAARSFVWGENDCCLFVARVIDAMTDSNLVAQLQALYQDEVSALRFIAAHVSLEGAVTTFLGEPSTERATRGDVVLFAGGEGDSVGICVGPEIVGVGPEGLHRVPRPVSEILRVWKV